MSIIPQAPADINECGILKVLSTKSTEFDGIATQVQQFISVATPMVDLVAAGPFRNYTLHNRDHAKKLVHLIDYLLPPETVKQLSLLECLTIVYSAFLHDMGMAVTTTERLRIIESADFQDAISDWPELAYSIDQVRRRLLTTEDKDKPASEILLFQLHEAALCEYLRPQHATPERYKQLIDHLKSASNNPNLFSFRGVSFENWVIDICASHNLDASVLNESKSAYDDRFPRELAIAQEVVNIQFCAAILRLTDILDFDRERTPRILFESLGLPSSDLPGAEVTLREWEKHLAVHTIDIRRDEIVVSAECHHPAIEKSIREFCLLIERELRDTMAVLKRNPPSVLTKYFFELPLNVRPTITSINYTYRDLALRINQSAIMSLLMGEKLYPHSDVALRELIQNALDACEVRRRIDNQDFAPQIAVSVTKDSVGRRWIEVVDNGIGMDSHVLGEYFLKLGDSYYHSPEFKRHFSKIESRGEPFHPISRFGIGILSVFLLGDALEVITKSVFSPRGDSKARMLRIERLGGLAFFSDSARKDPGTTVRVRLRPSLDSNFKAFAHGAVRYLLWLLIRPAFVIKIALGPSPLTFYLPRAQGSFYSISKAGKDSLLNLGYETIEIELSRWSNKLTGFVILLFAKNSDGVLSTIADGRRVRFQLNAADAIDPSLLIPNFTGNRITVNGFQIRNFRTRNLMRFSSGLRLSFLMDLDATGSSELEFDVSRERLTERGEDFLRNEIKKAALTAMAETEVFDRLAPELKMMMPDIPREIDELQNRVAYFNKRPDPLKYVFEAVSKELPDGDWPKGLHREIAKKLGVGPTLVSKIIGAMLKSGALKKPPQMQEK